METGYKIFIQGAQPGFAEEQVAEALAPMLKSTPEQLLPALRSKEAITLTLRDMSRDAAMGLKNTVAKSGCACILDSLSPLPAEGPPLSGNFGHLKLRPFVNDTVKLVLDAPAAWSDQSEETLFRVKDTDTGTWFTSSMNPTRDISLAVWAEIRFSAVTEKMTYLKPYRAPYSLTTAAGTAIAAEFRGMVPGDAEPTHQLVLCLRPEAGSLSLNITASVADFERHEALYQWLLRTQLHLHDGSRTDLGLDDPQAQFDMAVKLSNATQFEQAAMWLQKAAAQGHAQAQFGLGFCYVKGKGVPEDFEQAFSWWRKAAEQGHANAQLNLGRMYEHGHGITADPALSFHWKMKSAEQGDPDAQYAVAVCYVNGEGVNEDIDSAAPWALKAAEQGHPGAQFYAGFMYENGQGFPQDVQRAIGWYRKAVEQGHEKSQQRLQALLH